MRKIGVFLIMIGIFLLVLYLYSDMAGSPRVALLLAGGILLGLGIWILVATQPEEKPKSTRFRTVRQMKNRSAPTKKKKDKAQEPE